MTDERAEKDAEKLEKMLNNMSFDATKVAEKMSKSHNTIQQSFMRLCAEYIHVQAKKEHFDGRNEATGKACKKLAKVLVDENLYFPFI